jgi:hypothetical protein
MMAKGLSRYKSISSQSWNRRRFLMSLALDNGRGVMERRPFQARPRSTHLLPESNRGYKAKPVCFKLIFS